MDTVFDIVEDLFLKILKVRNRRPFSTDERYVSGLQLGEV